MFLFLNFLLEGMETVHKNARHSLKLIFIKTHNLQLHRVLNELR